MGLTFAGVDVGGERKGFHVALTDGRVILEIAAELSLRQTVEWLAQRSPTVVAIDAPPQALIQGPETRAAERALSQAGFRIQWTRRQGTGLPAPEWMNHGAALWHELQRALPNARLIETFPTAATAQLANSQIHLPLSSLALLTPHRATLKDALDACIAADVAARAHRNQTQVFGPEDELGPIHA
jgi:predicted nuclease with RNAse H fold